MPVSFESQRLAVAELEVRDTEDLSDCLSPETMVFMPYEAPHSLWATEGFDPQGLYLPGGNDKSSEQADSRAPRRRRGRASQQP
jgi:hypothetical protein